MGDGGGGGIQTLRGRGYGSLVGEKKKGVGGCNLYLTASVGSLTLFCNPVVGILTTTFNLKK